MNIIINKSTMDKIINWSDFFPFPLLQFLRQSGRRNNLPRSRYNFRFDIILELVKSIPFGTHRLALHEIELVWVGEISGEIFYHIIGELR